MTNAFHIQPAHVPLSKALKPAGPEKYLFWARNCEALADKLESIPDSAHDNSTWFNQLHQCGTTGCSLGIAAMSHVVPGLQFQYVDNDFDYNPVSFVTEYIVPLINGRVASWEEAGEYFFGGAAHRRVFYEIEKNKNECVLALRRLAKEYRENSR